MMRSLQRSWNSRNSVNWERVFCHPEAIRCSSQFIMVNASPLSGAPLQAMLNAGTLKTGLVRMVPAMASPVGTGTVVASLPQQPLLPSFSWPWDSTEQAFCVAGWGATGKEADSASLERHLFDVLDELGVMMGCPDASCTITGGGKTNSGDSSGNSANFCCVGVDNACPA